MKKVKFLVTSVLSFMLLTSSVYAACNYEEKAKFQQQLPYIGFPRLLYNAFPVPDWS